MPDDWLSANPHGHADSFTPVLKLYYCWPKSCFALRCNHYANISPHSSYKSQKMQLFYFTRFQMLFVLEFRVSARNRHELTEVTSTGCKKQVHDHTCMKKQVIEHRLLT